MAKSQQKIYEIKRGEKYYPHPPEKKEKFLKIIILYRYRIRGQTKA